MLYLEPVEEGELQHQWKPENFSAITWLSWIKMHRIGTDKLYNLSNVCDGQRSK